MKTATVTEHLAHYREIADEVAAGTPYTITRKGKPWLTLTSAWPAGRLTLAQKQKRLASYSKRPTRVVDALLRERQ
jgi:antitoxin (DNA-binding transcriptional repressor) of toxin-antitoxin stability system